MPERSIAPHLMTSRMCRLMERSSPPFSSWSRSPTRAPCPSTPPGRRSPSLACTATATSGRSSPLSLRLPTAARDGCSGPRSHSLVWPRSSYPSASPSRTFLLTPRCVQCLRISQPYVLRRTQDPQSIAAPSQTAPLISFVTYSFLEPLLWEAYRTGHLGADRVPPLIDTDRTSVVKESSFPYLDPCKLGRGKVSVVWGLLMTFRWSWLAQVGLLMLDVRCASAFARDSLELIGLRSRSARLRVQSASTTF
jgi:hypothetical protein